MSVARWLERVTPLRCPPWVLQIMPSTLEIRGLDGAGMSVSRQDARLAHPQQVDQKVLRDAEYQWSEPHVLPIRSLVSHVFGSYRVSVRTTYLCLRNPKPLVTVQAEDIWDNEIV